MCFGLPRTGTPRIFTSERLMANKGHTMRNGDPQLARKTTSWSAKNASWNQPVQRKISPAEHTAPARVAQAKPGVGATVDASQDTGGDFNTGNGGMWPRGHLRGYSG